MKYPRLLIGLLLMAVLGSVQAYSWREEPPPRVRISEIPEGTKVLNENAMFETWHRHYNQFGEWDYYCQKMDCCRLEKGFDEDEYTCVAAPQAKAPPPARISSKALSEAAGKGKAKQARQDVWVNYTEGGNWFYYCPQFGEDSQCCRLADPQKDIYACVK